MQVFHDLGGALKMQVLKIPIPTHRSDVILRFQLYVRVKRELLIYARVTIALELCDGLIKVISH